MKEEKNKKIILIVVGIVVLVGVFYGGMVYNKSQIPTKNSRNEGAQAFNSGAGMMGGFRNGGAGFTIGQIISKDATSITVSLQNGGSKIIFLGTSTTVSKMTTGSVSDLTTGTQVSVTGTPNTDGSINAQSIQIRPNIPPVLK